ncbi:MAG: hypothetical protein WDA00_03865 [Eubacteriales bacterium]
MKKAAHKSPAGAIRLSIRTMVLLAALCFLLPFLTVSCTESPQTVLYQTMAEVFEELFSVDLPGAPAPRTVSGLDLIFSFLSDKPLVQGTSIGPLPCNAYFAAALGLLLLGLALSFVRRFRHRDLGLSLACLAASTLLVLGRVRLVAYYTRFDERIGEIARFMDITAHVGLVLSVLLSFLAFMASLLLYLQSRADPWLRSTYEDPRTE